MLPAALLCHCGLCLLRQAWVPTPVAPLAYAYTEAALATATTIPNQMSFIFTSLTQVYFNEANMKQVDVPTQCEAFGILAAHVPTLQVVKPCVETVHVEDGTRTKYFVSSGSVTVNANSFVQLPAEETVALDMLDLVATKSSLEKAHSDLLRASDEAAQAEV